jgi:MEDS: MEthanogen/methylotroph, DcmR Sensory domain
MLASRASNGTDVGNGRPDHAAQLFDDEGSTAHALAAFTAQGLEREETVLIVASPHRWRLAARPTGQRARRFSEALESGQLTVLDSLDTLARLRRPNGPDPLLFDQIVGDMVRRLRGRGAPLRVYGDMVDQLALEADFMAALQLEELWNDLLRVEPCALLCGYSAVHFGNPSSALSLRRICGAHARVGAKSTDLLATFLLGAAFRRVNDYRVTSTQTVFSR